MRSDNGSGSIRWRRHRTGRRAGLLPEWDDLGQRSCRLLRCRTDGSPATSRDPTTSISSLRSPGRPAPAAGKRCNTSLPRRRPPSSRRAPSKWGCPRASWPIRRVRPDPVVVSQLGRSVDGGPRALRVVDFSAMWAGPLCSLTRSDRPAPTSPRSRTRPAPTGHGSVIPASMRASTTATGWPRSPSVTRRAAMGSVAWSTTRTPSSSRRGPARSANSASHRRTFCRPVPGEPGSRSPVTGGPRRRPCGSRSETTPPAAGGLVGRSEDGSPVFLADAAADPVSGLFAAFAGLESMASGGGHLVDVSMSAASRWAAGGRPCAAAHPVEQHGQRWVVRHGDQSALVRSPAEALALVDA